MSLFDTRRNFLRTLGAMLLAPIGRLFGWRKGVRLIINGIPIELPDRLHVRIEVDREGGHFQGPVLLEIVGGELLVDAPGKPAFHFVAKEGGSLHLRGQNGIMIENLNPCTPPTVDERGFMSFYDNGTAAITITGTGEGLLTGGRDHHPIASSADWDDKGLPDLTRLRGGV